MPHHHLVYTEDELKRIVSASHEVGILAGEEMLPSSRSRPRPRGHGAAAG
jgi:hypothetical protein